jgi:GNAT superfamily N-acetyltransferase
MTIRRPREYERSDLAGLWERSVRATHTFLTESDIEFYRPLVSDLMASADLDLWVLTDEADVPVGFLGLGHNSIEALFLEPRFRRRGGGRRLVEYAQARAAGALTVDVNEENVAARAFYEALGFRVTGRAPLDPMGRPHALLHLRRDVATPTLRVARPTDRLADVVQFYERGMGFIRLASFEDHDGFDGVILGQPGGPCQVEFTRKRGERAGRAPSQDHLFVFSFFDRDVWQRAVDRMAAVAPPVPSFNPYWDRGGRTFEDPDGYRVVLYLAVNRYND